MALVSILAQAQATDLTLLATVKRELGLTVSADDPFLSDLITQASSAIADYCRRTFGRQQISEGIISMGKETIMVSQPPIVALGIITYRGDAVPSDDPGFPTYFVSDVNAGLIYNRFGWISTAVMGWPSIFSVELSYMPEQPNPTLYAVPYTGGWLMPGDDIADNQGISFDGTADAINLASGIFPLLVPGDLITVFGSPHNSAQFSVVSATPSQVLVSTPLTTEVAGPSIGIAVRNLPSSLERAAIETVKGWYFSRDRDWATKMERIGTPRAGGWTAQYEPDDAFSSQTIRLLTKYVIDV